MPKRSDAKLSDRSIRSLPCPPKGALVVYDCDLPGFGIRLTAGGVRSFVLNYVVNRRERRMTIGRFPAWSTSAAREAARALKRKINLGVDPLEEAAARSAEKLAEREAPTVADLFERYRVEHLPSKSPSSATDDCRMWRTYILPSLGKMKVAAVSHDDVDRLHGEIGKTRPVRANRVIEVLRKALNLAVRWGWRGDNPAVGCRRNREEKRERFLTPKELLKLIDALAKHPERTSADAIHLLALTGARRSEVLTATWAQFDLERGIWTKPAASTKQRRTHRVPLSSLALAILARRSETATSRFVFPRPDPERHLSYVYHTWHSACRAAGLAELVPHKDRQGEPVRDERGETIMVWRPTLRLHDLRHTYASVLISRGEPLPIIGALLGHTQPQTTARYAHLLDDPLRAATEVVAEAVSGRG